VHNKIAVRSFLAGCGTAVLVLKMPNHSSGQVGVSMAEKGAGAGKAAPKAAAPKAGDEAKDMRNRRLYLAGRIASLKSELGALQKERTDIDDQLKNKLPVGEEKKLRQRRFYVATRPKELRVELVAAGAELKEILGKMKKAA
jgi:hypothetical protein